MENVNVIRFGSDSPLWRAVNANGQIIGEIHENCGVYYVHQTLHNDWHQRIFQGRFVDLESAKRYFTGTKP